LKRSLEGIKRAASTFGNIAATHCALGDYKAALEWNLKSYPVLQRRLGDSHLETITVLDNMQQAYAAAKLPQPFDEWLAARLAELPQPDEPLQV
jgi:hypothetical protein